MPQRLDQALVARGLVRSRSQAQDLIRRGLVMVAGKVAAKPALEVGDDAPIAVSGADAAMVSRGGIKLRAALDAFAFDPRGRTILDIGASTGGFTQELLLRGAAKVIAVDVGHGQLAPLLRDDARVVAMEGTDARGLTRATIGGAAIDAVVADLSFVSLKVALGPALALAAPGAWLVALVKPQFEVGRAGVGKGGIVRDEALREGAARDVAAWMGSLGWTVRKTLVSPIAGGSGNVEYLVGATRDD